MGKILSDPRKSKDILYVSDPYDDAVELVFLNTCGFLKSAREEMFEVVDQLLSAGKRICVV
ncbi:MAG: hypothetical protein GXP45_05765 [bacterium]|nr:hypothetical protein [bacterium]